MIQARKDLKKEYYSGKNDLNIPTLTLSTRDPAKLSFWIGAEGSP
jgi:hypothetical protein